ncbi:MAG TPA: class F sortase [Flexivirga sp.]|uniref:class F sortase n=1 Tax=Flexivirga sp. TaxID=1962927 RepID=UPI002C8C221B|nr:class F sortase [Flexivirga sp.]HWC21258.1 class F sortase [Flexivirga sp.]
MGTHMSRRRTKGTAAMIAGAAIAIAGGAVLVHSLGDDSTDPPTSAVGTTAPVSSSTSRPATTSHASGKSTGKSTGKRSGTPSHTSSSSSRNSTRAHKATVLPNPTSNSTPAVIANPAGAACIPKSLTVASVGIGGERVVPMGTNSQGQIYPPAHTTMWYNRSAQPGQNGISVIAGHVTYDGPDNFYNLRNVPIGAKVAVTCTNDKVVRLRVTHKESVPKTKLTTDQRVWGGSATPVVTLVTCDIQSPMVAGHHLNNYVVWTKPA